MFTYAHLDAQLDLLDGHYLGLVASVTDWRAGTVTETAYTGYGTRPAVTFGAAADTAPAGGRQRANTGTVSLPTNTGPSVDVVAWGLWTAPTGGTCIGVFPFDAATSTVGVIESTVEDIYAPAHGFSAGQRVFVLDSSGTDLPAELSANTVYWVIAAGLTTDSFRVSATEGGAAINFASWGSALFIPMTPVPIGTGVTTQFNAGALVIEAY